MATNVNMWLSGWKATGQNVSTPQYEQTVRIDWTDKDGVARTKTATVRFPNILATLVSAGLGEWVAHKVNDMLLEAGRKYLGVDD
jgi:predicted thioesterase